MTAQMTFETVRARSLRLDEFNRLDKDSPVLVTDSQFNQIDILVPAFPTDRATPFYNGKVELQSIYGVSRFYGPEEIWVACEDDQGQDMPLMPRGGLKATATLYIPGVTEVELQQRVRRALVNEFGPGLVELWRLRTSPTRDLRWDVYFERRELGPNREWVIAERKMAAKGVHDGHQLMFHGQEPAGWKVVFELHVEPSASVEVL